MDWIMMGWDGISVKFTGLLSNFGAAGSNP
jgi:hypothetical protein